MNSSTVSQKWRNHERSGSGLIGIGRILLPAAVGGFMKCANCSEPIEFYSVVGKSGFWFHPDLVDYDQYGTWCRDGEESAEPLQSQVVIGDMI
mgnify:CR=1 FL=1